jgi:hypothetical protein
MNGYRFYVGNDRYHFFKSFKVYWAYRWYLAEQMDKIGTVVPLISNGSLHCVVKSNFSSKYK